MYRIKEVTQEELKNIQVPKQEIIERYKGSKLNPLESYQLIKERSEGFTKDDPLAREADKYLYWLLYPEKKKKETSIVNDESFETYTMRDGFTWRILSIDEAKKRFAKNKKVYGINRSQETEHLIASEEDFDEWDEFAIQDTTKQRNQSNKKGSSSKIKPLEEMEWREKERFRLLELLELELELEIDSKKKTA